MSLNADIVSVVIKDGVKITTFNDGTQQFEPVKWQKPNIDVGNRSWWQKLKTWWNDALVKPYIKVRDLADPFGDRNDLDKGLDGKTGVEVGIKLDF